MLPARRSNRRAPPDTLRSPPRLVDANSKISHICNTLQKTDPLSRIRHSIFSSRMSLETGARRTDADYHSPTFRQLAALHERFSGPEIKIFHRAGIHPILYCSTLIGQNIPNLTYLIPFENLAAREKAWTAFAADPEWVKVRKGSIDRSGQVSSLQNISLWRATDYSPIK
jgi:hypothetical protein